MAKLPSEEDLFCKDERTHYSDDDHHQWAERSCKNRSSLLDYQSLDIVRNARRHDSLILFLKNKIKYIRKRIIYI